MTYKRVQLNAAVTIIAAITVLFFLVVLPFFNSRNKAAQYEQIELLSRSLALEWVQSADHESEYFKNAENRLDSLVARFTRRYPDSAEAAEAAALYEKYRKLSEDELIRQSDAYRAALQEQIDALKTNARDNILSIRGIELHKNINGSYDAEINWTNRSDKNIIKISFLTEARDYSGNPVICRQRDSAQILLSATSGVHKPNSSGAYYSSIFNDAFFADSLSHMELIAVEITYSDESVLYIPSEVIPYLY